MKTTIKLLKKHDEIKVIDAELDIYLEIAHLAYAEVKKEDGGKALLFTNVVDKKTGKKFSEPILMNVFGSYKRCELLFGRTIESVADEITKLLHMKPPSGFMGKINMAKDLFSLKNIFPKRLKGEGACQEIQFFEDEINLFDLPVLTTWEQDGGPFITMGQVYTQSLDGELVNLGMYRLQVYDKNHLGMHWQIHKDSSHFFDQYQKAGKKMPVTVAIGGNPLYTWCATAPLPYGVNELLMYGLITKTPAQLVKSLTNDLYIPKDVDYVIEGWVDTDVMKIEGPFGDHTGYYTLEEPYPVMEVSAISMKKEPTFLATVVGKPPLEDKYMGFATGKMKPLAKDAIRVVEEGQVRFVPRKWENTYFHWMRNVRDWCISRQLWWGHQIPVWYCNDCDHITVSDKDDVSACEGCQSKNIRQDEDVLDTWFSSAL